MADRTASPAPNPSDISDQIDQVHVVHTYDLEPVFWNGVDPKDIEPQTTIILISKMGLKLEVTGKATYAEPGDVGVMILQKESRPDYVPSSKDYT